MQLLRPILRIWHGQEHPFHGFTARHAWHDAERFRLRRAADDFGIEQVLGLGEGVGWCSARDRDGLTKLSGRVQIVDSAANDSCGSLNRAALATHPAMAQTDGHSTGKLHFPLFDTR